MFRKVLVTIATLGGALAFGTSVEASTYHPPRCSVAPSGNSVNCVVSRQWQINAGQPHVAAQVKCSGLNYWRTGAYRDVRNYSAAEQTVSVSCFSNGYAAGVSYDDW